MKRLLSLVAFFATVHASAQQVNPVPDYVFRNQMSVGRGTVTDTAAYFSIGPRYGATKGFMPPIVGDTATFSSGKRNGLLIFSVQKNKFLYWDSVRVQWSDMAGSSGAYIVAGDTSAMLAPYLRKADTTSMLTAYLRKGDTTAMLSPYYRSATASAALALKLNISDTSSMLGNYIRHAGYGLTKSGQSFLVDTLNIATRAWRQKGLDSLAALEVSGSGTTNRIPKFTASTTIGNSLLSDDGVELKYTGADGATVQGTTSAFLSLYGTGDNYIQFKDAAGTAGRIQYNHTSDYMSFNTASSERLRITSDGNVGIGATGSLLPLTVYNPTLNTPVLEVRGGGGSSQTRINLSYGNSTSTTLNGDIFASTTDFAFRAEAGRNLWFGTASTGSSTNRMQIFANGRIGINTTTDAGYQLDVNGTLRSVNGANFATTSGGVTIGSTASPFSALDVYGAQSVNYTAFRAQQLIWSTEAFNASPNASIGFLNKFTTAGGYGAMGGISVGKENATDGNALGYMSFTTYGPSSLTEKMRITSSGNVGINTASPVMPFQLNNYGGFDGNGNQLIIRNNVYYNSTNARSEPIQNGYQTQIEMENLDGKIRFSTSSASNNVGTAASLVERMRITNNGEIWINTTTDAGDYKLQVVGRGYFQGAQQDAAQTIIRMAANNASAQIKALDFQINAGSSLFVFNTAYAGSAMGIDFADAGTSRMRVTADGEVFVNTTSDAGDYKLQVVGNARVGTGKLDIASNTTFGIGVARSGTSEVAGQIYNSNGILYLGAESSAGGQIFSGSSAYAGVIGTGANYPLQFAVNNITRGGFSTSGNLLLGFTTDSYFLKLQVNGSIFSNNQFFGQGANAQLSIDSSTNISPLYVSAHSLTGTSAQAMLYSNTTWNTTGNPSLLDLNITNTASGATSNYIKITDGTNTFRVTKEAEVVTAAPTGGSIRKWKLGEAATVSPTSPNRTIRVEIDGTVYYLHAKTTND